MEYQTITNTFLPDTVKNLEIEAACAEISFAASFDEEIHVDAQITENGVYTCEMRQDTLFLSYGCHKSKIIGHPDYEMPPIVISLPDNFIWERINCEVAASKMLMEKVPLSCHNIHVEIAAGTWKANRLSVLQKLTAEAGAGKIKLSNAKAGSLRLDCGAAKFSYEGRVEKDFRVNCGVGTCKLQLENNRNDFDFDVSCALGSVVINERKISPLSREQINSSGSARGKGILECSVGKITLETT